MADLKEDNYQYRAVGMGGYTGHANAGWDKIIHGSANAGGGKF